MRQLSGCHQQSSGSLHHLISHQAVISLSSGKYLPRFRHLYYATGTSTEQILCQFLLYLVGPQLRLGFCEKEILSILSHFLSQEKLTNKQKAEQFCKTLIVE